MMIALPLLLVAACDVDNDSGNDQLRVEYNEQRIKDTASDIGAAAKEVGSGVGNVAADAGRSIKNEVGDIDVNVDVDRNRDRTTTTTTNTQ